MSPKNRARYPKRDSTAASLDTPSLLISIISSDIENLYTRLVNGTSTLRIRLSSLLSLLKISKAIRSIDEWKCGD